MIEVYVSATHVHVYCRVSTLYRAKRGNLIPTFKVPSSNLFFCGYDGVMYDETYEIIYEIIYEAIMGKFRASMEPF